MSDVFRPVKRQAIEKHPYSRRSEEDEDYVDYLGYVLRFTDDRFHPVHTFTIKEMAVSASLYLLSVRGCPHRLAPLDILFLIEHPAGFRDMFRMEFLRCPLRHKMSHLTRLGPILQTLDGVFYTATPEVPAGVSRTLQAFIDNVPVARCIELTAVQLECIRRMEYEATLAAQRAVYAAEDARQRRILDEANLLAQRRFRALRSSTVQQLMLPLALSTLRPQIMLSSYVERPAAEAVWLPEEREDFSGTYVRAAARYADQSFVDVSITAVPVGIDEVPHAAAPAVPRSAYDSVPSGHVRHDIMRVKYTQDPRKLRPNLLGLTNHAEIIIGTCAEFADRINSEVPDLKAYGITNEKGRVSASNMKNSIGKLYMGCLYFAPKTPFPMPLSFKFISNLSGWVEFDPRYLTLKEFFYIHSIDYARHRSAYFSLQIAPGMFVPADINFKCLKSSGPRSLPAFLEEKFFSENDEVYDLGYFFFNMLVAPIP